MLVGLDGLHVISVLHDRRAGVREVTVESAPVVMACLVCGVVAYSHGRRDVALVDVACFGRPMRLVWRKRAWCCVDDACDVGLFTERNDQVALPRALLTRRACWWAIRPIRYEHGSVSGVARQLGTT